MALIENHTSVTIIQELIGSNGSQIHASIRKGFPFSICKIVQHEFDLSEHEIAKILGVSPKTIIRRKEKGKLTSIESDRLYRFIRVLLSARQVFGDNEKVSVWLKSPNTGLGGLIPLNLLETEVGTRQVEDVLQRIKYEVVWVVRGQ